MQFIKSFSFCFLFFLLSVFCVTPTFAETILEKDYYQSHVQKIFDNRCVSCHSCFNGPCQLNLQNFNGFARGTHPLNIYHGTRPKSVLPTRLDIDAATVPAWQGKGFTPFSITSKIDENLFWKAIKQRQLHSDSAIKAQVAQSALCPQTSGSYDVLLKEHPELGMPYGLPPLTESEIKKIQLWLEAKAPGENKTFTSKKVITAQKTIWQTYLNKPDLRQKLISRYLYEHLFLAHLYFPESPLEFYRLVRSQTACEKSVTEIATRRPNDDPGVVNFYYCLKPFTATVVQKTHLPFELSSQKLARFKDLFNSGSWKVKELPTYAPGVAENPFVTFADIPVQARYQFLLDDARYHVATFIKGPVCNGSMAVNSIQEQFYVLFLNPKSDNMQNSAEYAKKVQDLLMLPGVWGSDIEITETPSLYKKLVEHREKYRSERARMTGLLKPQGYVLKDIWNGDGYNQNAILTVFRHDDNAVIQTGANGDLPKTAFVLDYALFERLVYNLVVNFDVFGNVSHQLLTRIYMDMIRMEAEELFLMFLPAEDRLYYRQEWYKGFLAKAKMTYVFPTVGSSEPTGIRYTEEADKKNQLIHKVLFYHFNDKVLGQKDFINWRKIQPPQARSMQNSLENQFSPLASVPAVNERSFARYFPDFSLVKVRTKNKFRVFSIIHNKEHENVSWITGESLRLAPHEDTLTILEGLWGAYPNQFFHLDEKELSNFVKLASLIKSPAEYDVLVKTFGVRRTQADFWRHYDEISDHFRAQSPVDAGVLDLTRYSIK